MRGNMWCQFCEINSHHRRNMAKEITFLPDAWKAKHMACLSHIFCIFLLCWQTGFGKMESAFHFSEISIYFLSFLFLFLPAWKGLFQMVRNYSKERYNQEYIEKIKEQSRNFDQVLQFYKRYHFWGAVFFPNSLEQDFSNERKQYLNLMLFIKIEYLFKLVKKLR